MSTQPADSSGDIVVTDQDLYDHAISDTPAPSAPETTPAREDGRLRPDAPEAAPQPQPEPQQPVTVRDEQGRFAPKPAQEPAKTQQDAPQAPLPQQRQTEDNRVPVATLLQERERAYRAEAELNQMRQAWAQYQQQVAAQQQQQQPPQTIFDEPDQYITQNFVAPLRQEFEQREMLRTEKMSREFANREFGVQRVNEALAAMQQVRHTPQGDFVFRQIMDSGHPYGALIAWYGQARAQQAIGPDPQAWLRKQQEQWFNDPKVQAAVIQHVRQQQQTNGRPSNVSLPPSLSSLPSSSGRLDDQGDMSNESLYRFATK